MSRTIHLPKSINTNDVTFSEVKKNNYGGKSVFVSYDGSPLIVQTPYMPMPFGMSEYESPDSGVIKYSADFSFRNMDENKSVEQFYELLKNLDDKLVTSASENCVPWFGKSNYDNEEIVRALYSHQIRHSIDKETGEINNKYAPTFKLKIPNRNGRFLVEVYNNNNERTYDELQTLLKKNTKARALMMCSGIWFAGGKFGLSWKLLHLQVQPSATMDDYAFIQDSDDEEDDDVGASFYGQSA